MITFKEQFNNAFAAGWSKPFIGNSVDWIEQNVILPHNYQLPGKVNLHRSKYLIEPLLAASDINVHFINCMASVQSGKTFLIECYMLFLIANSSGTLVRFAQSDDMAKKMVTTRLLPLMQKCNAVKKMIPTEKYALSKSDIYFPNFNLHITSAKENNLQSLTAKFIIADECWLYKEGDLSQAISRTTAFQYTRKIFFISQAGLENDEWNNEFKKGQIYEWGWTCPHCSKKQIWNWTKKIDNGVYAGITWDTNAKTKPDGVWNYYEAAKTARLVCEHCLQSISDTPANRRLLNDTGEYICSNPNGNPQSRSYRWPAMSNVDISFSQLVIQYLQAKDAASMGNKTPLREFTQQFLAQPWAEHLESTAAKIILEEYNPTEEWGDYTFMTIDCQNNFSMFPYVIRRWNKNGESRLIKYGWSPTWTDIRQVQLDNRINDQCVFIDSGNMATQVYAKCVEYGHAGFYNGRKVWFSWIAGKGWDADEFVHADGSKRLYAPESKGDPNLGKTAQGRQAPLYRWSNRSIKNILTYLRDGKGAKWVANEVCDEYTKQLNSEIFVKELDKRTGKEKWRWVLKPNNKNDLFDCECMQVVMAAMVGIVGKSQT